MEHKTYFNHDFKSCSRTYATLCIYHDSADPQMISDMLQLNPDKMLKIGDVIRSGKTAISSGWFLGTKDLLQSRDVRYHIEWILNQLNQKKDKIKTLYGLGFKMKILCFWESSSGNGGPVFDHEFICRLSEFPLDLDLDIWFDDAN